LPRPDTAARLPCGPTRALGHGHCAGLRHRRPFSKHGVWHEDPRRVAAGRRCRRAHHRGLCTRTSALGPQPREFDLNMRKLGGLSSRPSLRGFPDANAVNFGGGIPHPYRPNQPAYESFPVPGLCCRTRSIALARAAGRRFGSKSSRALRRSPAWPPWCAGSRHQEQRARMPKARAHQFVMVDGRVLRPRSARHVRRVSSHLGWGVGAGRTPSRWSWPGRLRKRGRVQRATGTSCLCRVSCAADRAIC